MGNIAFFTGGARSGKSSAAQKRAIDLQQKENKQVIYVATGINIDEEMNLRIQKHKEDRPKDFITIECPYDIDQSISRADCIYIIDCMTIYITNMMLKIKDNWGEEEILTYDEQLRIEKAVLEKITALIECITKNNSHFIIVSNELGMGLVPPYAFGRIFRDVAGRVNSMIAKVANEVYLCVSGIEMKIK